MKLLCTVLLALILLTLTAQAQTDSAKTKKKRLDIDGLVADSFTKAPVPDVLVTLMRSDSTVVRSTRTFRRSNYLYGFGNRETTGYYFTIEREPAEYILKLEHPNYETAFTNVSVKRIGRRQEEVEVPTVYLKKTTSAPHFEGGTLGEVVVKATKVKMVWRGDTLVYNADAFNVPEGSMLDGLIKQLPGVKLTEGGEIFVNGKKVQNLTLNGADFFKGKNKIMLENLPYYTVKRVEVYKKQTPENKYYGIDDEDKKEYTMDVVLKREYNIGGTANVEAGGGPSEGGDWRYKLKAFGLRYSDHTRAVLFGGANNINQTAEYDTYDESYDDRTYEAGNDHFRQIGGMFTYLGPEDKMNNSTEVNTEWNDDHNDHRYQSETFLANSASTFGQSESHSHRRLLSLRLNNTFRASGLVFINSYMTFNYKHRRSDSESQHLTAADALYADSINTSRHRSHSRSQAVYGYGYIDIGKRMSSGDNLQLRITGNFNRDISPQTESENHYIYHQLGTSDDRYRRSRSPYSSHSVSARFSYHFSTKGFIFRPFYQIQPKRTHNDSREYLRDSIDYVLDQDNSYETTTESMNHQVGCDINYFKITKERGHYGLTSTLCVNFDRQHLSYDPVDDAQNFAPAALTRHYTLFAPDLNFFYTSKGSKIQFNANYQFRQATPYVTDLLCRPFTSDPLNIYLANPDLRMSATHYWSASYSLRRDSIDQTLSLRLRGNTTLNNQSGGYAYDMATGVRTHRKENIKRGNWNMSLVFYWGRSLDKKKLWSISSELSTYYRRSTTLASVPSAAESQQPVLSRVDNLQLRYMPYLYFQKSVLSLRLGGALNYRHIHRNITIGEQPTDLWDFNYGLHASYKLPLNFSVDTDLSVHQRRGYLDAEANDNRLYWDASVTKSLMKGRWVLTLRGYDLLGQVSSMSYEVDAQGRSETWSNVLRRYALLTASYRFSQKPKKKE